MKFKARIVADPGLFVRESREEPETTRQDALIQDAPRQTRQMLCLLCERSRVTEDRADEACWKAQPDAWRPAPSSWATLGR